MTCREALVSMLGADPPELAGEGNSPVARHVRECARCGAVAARLMSESRLLASAVERDVIARRAPRQLAWRPVGAFAGTLALAAMVLVVVMRRPANPGPATPEPSAVSVSIPGAPTPVAPPVEKSTATGTARHHARTGARAVATATIPDSRFPIPVRLEAVPIRPIAIAAASPSASVAVEPSAGNRAAIIRTSNPAVTVVWIY